MSDFAPVSAVQSAQLPCVLQVGFSGSRALYDPAGLDAEACARFDAEIEARLRAELRAMRGELGVPAGYFLAGVSQIAIGGDTHFVRCCDPAETEGVAMLRILLPQPIDSYLTAVGSSGPDFTPEQRAAAHALLKRPAIVHVQSVSSADTRAERFTDALHAIVATCDVGVCLIRQAPAGRPGGSVDFLDFARKAGKPVRLIEVAIVDGRVRLTASWRDRDRFKLPKLPALAGAVAPAESWAAAGLPSAAAYCAALKSHFSPKAREARERFTRMARIILRTHLGATICAAVAIVASFIHGGIAEGVLVLLLLTEIGLLIWGHHTHHELLHGGHSGPTVQQWASARLTAEISRSVSAVGATHLYLAHLSILRILPILGLDRLVTTINWLHLRATAPDGTQDFTALRDAYLTARVDDQIKYLGDRSTEAAAELKKYRSRFTLWWTLGLSATALKLAEVLIALVAHPTGGWETVLAVVAPLLGVFAVVFPVLAVGALSWAAAQDLEARASEFAEIRDFLIRQRPLFEQVATTREVRRLIIETETALLGEVAQWYVRRSYSSVA